MRFCLVGQGITHSLSPVMMGAALRATGLGGEYCLRDGGVEELTAVVAELRRGEISGANVTMPHKQTVAPLCDRLAGDAAITGAVNTLVAEGGEIVGENTDVGGFGAALEEAQPGINARGGAVVLGAGGAALAVVLALSRRISGSITVSARRGQQAEALAHRLAGAANPQTVGWGSTDLATRLRGADVIVNATPAGVAALPLRMGELSAHCCVVDLRYRAPVDVVEAARAAGHPAIDGLGMLLHQGVLGFRLWTGIDAPIEVMRDALAMAVRP